MGKMKTIKMLAMAAVFFLLLSGKQVTTYAAEQSDTILEGVFVETLDLSGMTEEEANQVVTAFVEDLKTRVVTFGAPQEHYVAVVAGDLGLTWKNTQVIQEACELGKGGNIVKRYKAIQDLKHGNAVFQLQIDFDQDAIRTILTEQCAEYDVLAVNTSLRHVNDVFEVVEGQTGLAVNIEDSFQMIYQYLVRDWDFQDASIDLVIDVTQPKGSAEELADVRDVLGSFTTDYTNSSAARSKNVENGCNRINGTTLYPGEEFSACETMRPFTEANGYYPAGAYLNGKVIESVGGGICQVSTTLYNALLLSELEITQRSSHSMIVDYVQPSMDAAIAENGGKDLKFKNNMDSPIYIEGYTSNKKITFVIYGVETREQTHSISFESEVLSTTNPSGEVIVRDAAQPIGYVDVQKAHIGYKAQLWKVVKENEVEVSKEVINKSSYAVSPRTATVGVATSEAAYAARIENAIASGSIDVVKVEAAAIKAEQTAIQNFIDAQSVMNQQEIVAELP